MKPRRMRVFAGPNGSGKSTLVNEFIKQESKLINPSRHINPDDIGLLEVLDFDTFGLKVDERDFQNFISRSPFYDDSQIDIENIKINDNRFNIKNINSYTGAMLAEYIRGCYINSKETLFSYETAFSHSSKVDFLKNAKDCG